MAQLSKLDVHLHEYYLPELLIIFSSVDVLLYGKIVDWLSCTYGVQEAQRLVSAAMVNWAGMPLEIEETVSYGHIIACRCGAPKPKGPEVEDDEEEDDEDAYGKKSERGKPLPKFVEEVSATTAEQPFISGTILATIRVGDLLRVKSHSRLWWLVYEVRPVSGTVLLCNKESRVRGSSGSSRREAKTEYREVKLSTLLGCMVRREGVLSAQTLKYQRRPDMSFQECLICTPKDAEKEGFVGANADAFDGPGSRRVSVLFQIPGPDLRASVARIKALVEEYPAIQTAEDAKGRNANNTNGRKAAGASVEPLQHMQHQAQAKAFVARWEEAQRARQILSKMDPFSCVLARERWLLAARALKTISRGGTELLQDFINLTKAAGREGQLRARDCRVAWECLRPSTSADLPALSKARAYLKMRGAGKAVAFFDDAGRLRPEAMQVDPLARGILEAAATFLTDRNVVFLAQAVDQTKVSNDVALNLEAAALHVAGATYSHYLSSSSSSSSTSSSSSSAAAAAAAATTGSKGGARTVFESVETVRAYLAPGDVIMVRGAVGEAPPPSSDPTGSAPAAAAKGYSWAQVLSVDLLFARLRVLPCAAPPECWYLPSLRPDAVSHAGSADTPACWLALSRVWDCTVCRLLPMASPSDAALRQGKHLVFVTPMPSPAEALAALAAFDKKTQAVAASSAASAAAPAAAGRSPLRESVSKSRGKGKGAAAAAAAAAASRPGAKKAKFSVAAISYFTDAVIVAWTAVKILPAPFINAQGEVVTPTPADLSVVYSLEVAHISSPYEWKLVYTGAGVGCQISGLEPLSQYYVRVTANASLPQTLAFRRGGPPGVAEKAMEQERRRAQTVVTTLGTAVPAVPTVQGGWERSSSGNARALIEVFSPKRTIMPPLPAECFYQIEASLGASSASSEDGDEEGGSGSWAAVGRTRSPRCWVVGAFAGRTILLRTRVVNQMGQPGAASPVAIVEVPSEPGQVAAAVSSGRGLNDSALSDLTAQR